MGHFLAELFKRRKDKHSNEKRGVHLGNHFCSTKKSVFKTKHTGEWPKPWGN